MILPVWYVLSTGQYIRKVFPTRNSGPISRLFLLLGLVGVGVVVAVGVVVVIVVVVDVGVDVEIEAEALEACCS